MSRALAALAAVVLAFAGAAAAQPATQPAPRVTPLPDGVRLTRPGCVIEVTAKRDDIVRVRIGRDALPEDASWSVLPAARGAAAPVIPLTDAGSVGFRTASVTVRLDRATGALSITDKAGAPLLSDAAVRPLTLDAAGFTLRKTLPPDEHIFGLGDKAGPLDRRGEAFSLWNTDAYAWRSSSDPLYKSIPFYIAVDDAGRAHGLLLDDTWRTAFDFGRADPAAITITAQGGPIDYYVMAGPSPKAVVEAYAWLTGPSPMPPLWALGFQQSRYSYMSAAEVRSVAARLRAERLPADAIYLDIDYQDRNRPFTVNTTTFPDLAGLTRDLAADGFHLVVITDLHIADAPGQGYAPYDSGLAGYHFLRRADGSLYVGEVWPGPSVFPDFTRADSRAWWGGLYRDFRAEGVAGFWNDMNEPAVFATATHTMPPDVVHRIAEPGFAPRTAPHAEIHNVYGMENARATYEGLIAERPDERPFVLTRASFAGGQRFAATWTGDNDSTWDHLWQSAPMLENLGLSGFAWSGADVGGFAGSPSADLMDRWMEIAAFTPLYRDHADKASARREPWVDGPAHTDLRRRFIEARYRLLPYLYALADETSRTGLPLLRPLFLEFPAWAGRTHDTDGEFMVGPDLVVAASPRLESRDAFTVRLPGDGWYDYWTGKRLAAAATREDGPEHQSVTETPSLERLPVFVRPGAIIPRQAVVQSTGERPEGPLELNVYPGPDCRGTLYWDDGHSLRRDAAAVLRQQVRCAPGADGGSLRIAFDAREGGYPPWWRSIALVVHGWRRTTATASLDGAPIAAAVDADGAVHVSLPDRAGPSVVVVR